MDTLELKKLAASKMITMELSKEDKIHNLDYIKTEATDTELKSFILDESYTEYVGEAKDILDSRFECHTFKG